MRRASQRCSVARKSDGFPEDTSLASPPQHFRNRSEAGHTLGARDGPFRHAERRQKRCVTVALGRS
jgi:hypothetical protein